MARKTPQQKIADLKKKEAEVKAKQKKQLDQIKAQLQNENAKIAVAKRKEDTHCKVVNGALSFAFFQNHPELSTRYIEWIKNSSESQETKEKILARL